MVSDCSLVASLAVSAQYEKKFGRRLITSIIYPKNKHKEPVYNPFGNLSISMYFYLLYNRIYINLNNIYIICIIVSVCINIHIYIYV